MLSDPSRPMVAIPRRLAWTWLGLLALSQFADLATTWLGVGSGLSEENPFVRATLASGHFPLFVAVKLALVLAMTVAVTATRPGNDRRMAMTALRFLVVVFTGIAAANLAAAVIAF